jgi:hypothetical protein
MARSYNKSNYGSDSGDSDVFSPVSLQDRTTPGFSVPSYYGGDLGTRERVEEPNPFLQGFGQTRIWGMPGPERENLEYQQTPGQANQGAIQDYVNQAAEAYRNLPFGATSEQRNAAMQQYKDAIAARNAPAQAPDSEERYNKFLMRRGINPNTIGTARLNEQGGLDVLSPIQEEAAMKTRDKANQLASMLHRAQMFSGDRRSKGYNPEKAIQAYQGLEGVRAQGGIGSYEGGMQAALRNQGLIPNPFTQPRRNLYRPEEEEGTANGFRG